MAQFDVYRVEGGLVVDVQTDLIGDFPSRLVIPLRQADEELVSHYRLNPIVFVDEEPYVLVTQHMAAIRSKLLGRRIGNLDRHYDEIKSAYDMLFNGF